MNLELVGRMGMPTILIIGTIPAPVFTAAQPELIEPEDNEDGHGNTKD